VYLSLKKPNMASETVSPRDRTRGGSMFLNVPNTLSARLVTNLLLELLPSTEELISAYIRVLTQHPSLGDIAEAVALWYMERTGFTLRYYVKPEEPVPLAIHTVARKFGLVSEVSSVVGNLRSVLLIPKQRTFARIDACCIHKDSTSTHVAFFQMTVASLVDAPQKKRKTESIFSDPDTWSAWESELRKIDASAPASLVCHLVWVLTKSHAEAAERLYPERTIQLGDRTVHIHILTFGALTAKKLDLL